MTRVLHFSDIHLRQSAWSVPLTDWLGKRLIGQANLLFGRADKFADAHAKVEALDRFRREQDVDLVVFTGDYTALGTEAELREARKAVAPLMEAPRGYVHVPGNHDLYVSDVIRQKRFRRHFEDAHDTDMPEHKSDHTWPIVRLVGEHVAVVAVNSAKPNPLPWVSSGKIPPAQLEAFERILSDGRLRSRFVFVITHYAPRRAGGERDSRLHGMKNADAFLDACSGISAGAILCGHIHERFHVPLPNGSPLFCAGSTTKDEAEGLWVFDVDADGCRATPGGWLDDRYALDEDSAFSV